MVHTVSFGVGFRGSMSIYYRCPWQSMNLCSATVSLHIKLKVANKTKLIKHFTYKTPYVVLTSLQNIQLTKHCFYVRILKRMLNVCVKQWTQREGFRESRSIYYRC